MEIVCISKPPSKWFSNKGLRLSLPRLRSKPKSSRAITKEDALQAVFRRFDSDGNGKISSEELAAYFTSIGDKILTEEAKRIIEDFDNNRDDSMEFKDFVKLMEGDNEGDDFRRAFEMFEVDKGGECITPVGLQRTLNRLGDVKSYEECVAMIRVFDLDGN